MTKNKYRNQLNTVYLSYTPKTIKIQHYKVAYFTDAESAHILKYIVVLSNAAGSPQSSRLYYKYRLTFRYFILARGERSVYTYIVLVCIFPSKESHHFQSAEQKQVFCPSPFFPTLSKGPLEWNRDSPITSRHEYSRLSNCSHLSAVYN